MPGNASMSVRSHDERLVAIVVDKLPALVLVDGLVHLDVLAAGEPDDAARLVTVQHDLAVLLLERDADALGDEVGDDRADHQQGLQRVDDAFHREIEVGRDDVGRRRRPEDRVERHTRRADRRARRRVTRTLGDVVLSLVSGDPGLDERVDRNQHDEQPEPNERYENVERPGAVEEHDLPAGWNEPQCAVGEADVPVWLCACRDRGRVVRAVIPDRVDREQRGDEHDHAERDEEEPAHLRHVHRHHRVADDVAVRATRAGELRVLVDHHEHQVKNEQADQDGGQQQDVQRVEATDDRGAGELAAEQQERDPRADQRDALDHAVDDAQTVARQQVVGKGVAGEALGHREDEQDEADHPVQLARFAESTGEEDAQHVHADAGDEHQRGPVVDLSDQEAPAQIERDPE